MDHTRVTIICLAIITAAKQLTLSASNIRVCYLLTSALNVCRSDCVRKYQPWRHSSLSVKQSTHGSSGQIRSNTVNAM